MYHRGDTLINILLLINHDACLRAFNQVSLQAGQSWFAKSVGGLGFHHPMLYALQQLWILQNH